MQTLTKSGYINDIFGDHFNSKWLIPLLKAPKSLMHGQYSGHDYVARLIIPDHLSRVVDYYSNIIKGDFINFCQRSEIGICTQHFGVEIRFSESAELVLHDIEYTLDKGLRELIAAVGAVVIKNGYMADKLRKLGHRNRFPHLNFHVDRSANQPTHYSMYARDPFDDEQRFPRTSSTLFIPSIVGHLQAIKEGSADPVTDKGIRGTYNLFTKEPVAELMNDLILEHRWDEPLGVGEISMLNNLTLLHSSYYRNLAVKGYKIGVRYLA